MRSIWGICVGSLCASLVASSLVAHADEPPAATQAASEPRAVEPLVVEGVVKAPVEDVWAVFSTAEGFKKLGVAKCEIDLRIGGLMRSHYSPEGTLGDEGTIMNEILSYEPPHMMSFRIHRAPKGFPFAEETWKRTWSVATFSDLGDGRTHVRLATMGYTDSEDSRKMRKFFEAGNTSVMRFLEQQFDASAPKMKGPSHAEQPLAPVVAERVVEASRGDVWKLLTTADGWKRVCGATANIDLRPGGKFEVRIKPESPTSDQGSGGCTVLSVLPERMISFTWNAPPMHEYAGPRKTWVVVELEAISPTRTRVRLEHRGFAEAAAEDASRRDEWQTVRAFFNRSWPEMLEKIATQARR